MSVHVVILRQRDGKYRVRLSAIGRTLAVLTRSEAEQLRDDLTAQLLDHSGETPAERAHRELHDGTDTYLPPERAA